MTVVEAPWYVAPVVRPITGRLLACTLAVGCLGDLALRSGIVGLGGALLVAATAVVLLASGRITNTHGLALVAAAPVFGMWIALRTSAWLLPFDVIAAGVLLALGASLGERGSLTDLPFARLAAHGCDAIAQAVLAPLFARRPDAAAHAGVGRRARRLPIIRGAALALPVLAVLGALLASADAVFASFFSVDVDGLSLTLHAVFISVSTWAMLWLLRVASVAQPHPLPAVGARLGTTEVTVVLGSVIGLFATFAASQLVAVSGGADHVLETAGLTYAEYARSGFFQLLWVAGLTVGGLLMLRSLTASPRFVPLAEAVIALTLAIVVVAFRRLALYEDAYGLTMLRLYCSIAAVLIGVVLVLVGASLAGVGRGRAWLPGAIGGLGLAVLLGLNVVNPEAIVVRHNLGRDPAAVAPDPAYLADLSDDAVPAIVALLPTLDLKTQDALRAAVGCVDANDAFRGWAAANLSKSHAADARANLCRG